MQRLRARQLLGPIGILPTGLRNTITDVPGVMVGQTTLHNGKSIHTGVTAILPHNGSIFTDKVPAGVFVANGFGKLAGSTQVEELGELETPILLTNTLAVPTAMQASLEYTLAQNPKLSIRSINAVIGETNDGILNDIASFPLTKSQCIDALVNANSGPVEEGAVGAGSGTMAFGWKGGIGSSSRMINIGEGYTLGALVQSNFGGQLILPNGYKLQQEVPNHASTDGSVMIILATDAPLSDRNLKRLAVRAMAGLARTGAAFSNGSGDYAIAFSTNKDVRRTAARRAAAFACYSEIPNDSMSDLFLAAIESVQEAILNSLFMATSIVGHNCIAQALPLEGIKIYK